MCACCLPVPLQAFVVEPVEEVRLCTERPDVRVDAQELQQGARASFLYADDDGLRKFFRPEGVGVEHGDAVSVRVALRSQELLVRVHLPLRVLGLRAVRVMGRRCPQLLRHVIVTVRSALAVDGPRSRVAESREAVEEVGEDQDHGKEHGDFGEHLPGVEPDSEAATSHELISCSTPVKDQNGVNMLPPPTRSQTCCVNVRISAALLSGFVQF